MPVVDTAELLGVVVGIEQESQLAGTRNNRPEFGLAQGVAQLDIVDFGLMDPLTRFTPPS